MSIPADEIEWASPRSLAPDKSLLDRVGLFTADARHDCILIGPSGVGKSSFLGALGRDSAHELEGTQISLARGNALADLSGKVALALGSTASALEPTANPATYDFQVTVQRQPGATPLEVEVLVQDWPGGILFRPDREKSLAFLHEDSLAQRCLRVAQETSNLVLCIDSMHPDRLLWEIVLPQLLSNLSISAGRLLPRMGRVGRTDLPPILSPKRHLPFDRVLILLTKIDLVCTAVTEAVSASGLPSKGPVSPLLVRLARSPRELARHLDPLRLAEECLGRALLDQLLSVLKPGAELAVGLSSAWGFETLPGGDEQPGPALDKWSPFGLDEAILYLATGDTRPPVTPISSKALGSAQGRHWRKLRLLRSRNNFLRFLSTLGGNE